MVDDPVGEPGQGHEGAGEAVGDGDALQAVVLGHGGGGKVADDQHDDHVDGGGDTGHQGAGEGEVPVVPDVNVDGLGGVGEQHDDVHHQAQGDDHGANIGGHGDGGGGGPAHVDDRQGEAVPFHHGLGGGAKVLAQQAEDGGDAHQADAHGQTGAERLAGLGSEEDAQQRHPHGHHNRGTQVLDKADHF